MHVNTMAIERKLKGVSYPTEEFQKFDKYTHAITVITEQHRLCHDGAMYIYSVYIDSIPAKSYIDFLVVQEPIVPPAHIRQWRLLYTQGPLILRAFENTVTSDDGLDAGARNMNRNHDDSGSSLQFMSNPVVSDPGDQLLVQLAPRNVGQTEALGEEWVLKRSGQPQKYLLRVYNDGFLPTAISFDLYWYVPPYDKAKDVGQPE